jgi:hypothetical protein
MSHFALYENAPLQYIRDYCLEYLPPGGLIQFGYIFQKPWPGDRVRETDELSVAIATVHAVVDLVADETSLMAILAKTLQWGGDTDSVAAIAWGIASARYQNEVLPEFLLRDLEANHPSTAPPYLHSIGLQLMEKYQ